jgi:hypothetical protein
LALKDDEICDLKDLVRSQEEEISRLVKQSKRDELVIDWWQSMTHDILQEGKKVEAKALVHRAAEKAALKRVAVVCASNEQLSQANQGLTEQRESALRSESALRADFEISNELLRQANQNLTEQKRTLEEKCELEAGLRQAEIVALKCQLGYEARLSTENRKLKEYVEKRTRAGLIDATASKTALRQLRAQLRDETSAHCQEKKVLKAHLQSKSDGLLAAQTDLVISENRCKEIGLDFKSVQEELLKEKLDRKALEAKTEEEVSKTKSEMTLVRAALGEARRQLEAPPPALGRTAPSPAGLAGTYKFFKLPADLYSLGETWFDNFLHIQGPSKFGKVDKAKNGAKTKTATVFLTADEVQALKPFLFTLGPHNWEIRFDKDRN